MNPASKALLESAKRSLPPLEGDLDVPGLRQPVEIIRDAWGVPHIYAQNEHDLFFAQGFVMGWDRGFQIEFLSRAFTGRLSELFSEVTLPLDRFIRTIGWNRAGRKALEQWDDRSQEISLATVRGLRAAQEVAPTPVEYSILHAEPWLPSEREAQEAGASGSVFMAWILSRAWDNELMRAEIAERLGPEAMGDLFPDLPVEAAIVQSNRDAGDRMALLREALLPPSGQGSNNWVLGGSRTVTGKPLLANDPHLLVQCPAVWYEVHLSAPGIDVAGVALPFSPGVIIGHNERIAWGFTNTEADVQDLYLERISEDGTTAEYMGSWEPLTVHREEIWVRGREEPEVVEVRESRHGPILDSYTLGIGDPIVVEGGIRKTYALRWVGHERVVQVSTIIALNQATDWEEFRAAASGWHCPGQNMVYADVDGNIGYQFTGDVPIRRKGDGTLPVPGWTDEYEWEGFVPFDELPRAFNPDSGFIATANHRVYDAGYPYNLGHEFLPPYRARRLVQLITEREQHSAETFARMQVDTVSLPAKEIVPHLLSMEPADDRQKEALALLAEWNHDLAADSASAAIYEVWLVHVATRVLRPLLGDELFTHFYSRREWTNGFHYQVLPNILVYPTARFFGADGIQSRDRILREALDGALDELSDRLGDDMSAWRWGAIHRVRFAGRLAIIPDLTDVFTAGELELGGDEQTVLQALYEPGVPYDVVVTPSWREILDLSDWDASLGVITIGQSGNPASPHFRDQVDLWAEGRHHPLPFSRQAVEKAAAHTLTLKTAE